MLSTMKRIMSSIRFSPSGPMTPPGNCAGLEAAPSWDTASSMASLVTILVRVVMVSLYLITIVTVTCRVFLITESFTNASRTSSSR